MVIDKGGECHEVERDNEETKRTVSVTHKQHDGYKY